MELKSISYWVKVNQERAEKLMEEGDSIAASNHAIAASVAMVAYKLGELGFNNDSAPGTTEAIAIALGFTRGQGR